MNDEKGYYVVEFRLPFYIAEVENEKEAATAAAKQCEKEYGFYPSAWYARVFEYGDLDGGVGIIAEYFANPTGTVFRKIDGNVEKHEEIIKKQQGSDH